jgi:hypothetical protein
MNYFYTVGIISTYPNYSEVNTYTYIDSTLTHGHLYYRIKQISKDGSYAYSHIIKLEESIHAPANVYIYPNPFQESINVVTPVKAELILYKLTGEKIYTTNVNNGIIQLGQTLDRGVYLLQLRTEDTISFARVIKE